MSQITSIFPYNVINIECRQFYNRKYKLFIFRDISHLLNSLSRYIHHDTVIDSRNTHSFYINDTYFEFGDKDIKNFVFNKLSNIVKNLSLSYSNNNIISNFLHKGHGYQEPIISPLGWLSSFKDEDKGEECNKYMCENGLKCNYKKCNYNKCKFSWINILIYYDYKGTTDYHVIKDIKMLNIINKYKINIKLKLLWNNYWYQHLFNLEDCYVNRFCLYSMESIC